MVKLGKEDRLIGEGVCADSDYQWYIYERKSEEKKSFMLTIDGPLSGSIGDIPTNIWTRNYSSIVEAMEVGMAWTPEKFLSLDNTSEIAIEETEVEPPMDVSSV